MSQKLVFTGVDVCPDLVSVDVYGHHASWVYDGRRTWKFADPILGENFEKAALAGDFRRQPKNDPTPENSA